MPAIAPPPFKDPLVDRQGYVTKPWAIWFQQSLVERAEQSSQILLDVPLTAQNASIGTTPIPTGTLASGTYRVNYYAAITTAAVTSSSLIPTFSWTDGAVSKSFSGAAMTGNTTSTTQSDSFLINVDASTAVSYATTYASNGAGQMQYALTVFLEYMGT